MSNFDNGGFDLLLSSVLGVHKFIQYLFSHQLSSVIIIQPVKCSLENPILEVYMQTWMDVWRAVWRGLAMKQSETH